VNDVKYIVILNTPLVHGATLYIISRLRTTIIIIITFIPLVACERQMMPLLSLVHDISELLYMITACVQYISLYIYSLVYDYIFH